MSSTSWPDQPETMRTRGGVRITARPANGAGYPIGDVVLVIAGMFTDLTPDESHQLRDLLQAAELGAARGAVIT